MAANYATAGYTTTLGGASYTVLPGVRRDTVTDATLIATLASDWTATVPVASATTITGVMAGYLAAYPTGNP